MFILWEWLVRRRNGDWKTCFRINEMFNRIFICLSQAATVTKGLKVDVFFFLAKLKMCTTKEEKKNKHYYLYSYLPCMFFRSFFIIIFKYIFYRVSHTKANLNAHKSASFWHKFIVVERHVIWMCMFSMESIHFNICRKSA